MGLYKTIRTVYLDILTELVKEESPTLYLEDFLYYYNKAISEYMKLRYEKFELTQQLTDDMRTWKEVHTSSALTIDIDSIGKYLGSECGECGECVDAEGCVELSVDSCAHLTDEGLKHGCESYYLGKCNAESDKCKECKGCKESKHRPYRHVLGAIIEVELLRPVRGCEQSANSTKKYKVTRSTSAKNAGIVDNCYLDAKFYRPYFDIIGKTISIEVGDINPKWIKIRNIRIEYLRQPAEVFMAEGVLEIEEDNSQELEFPTDVADEITKRCLMLILERQGNPRMQSNAGVNQTVNDISLGGGKK